MDPSVWANLFSFLLPQILSSVIQVRHSFLWPFSSTRTSWGAENLSLILLELENYTHPPFIASQPLATHGCSIPRNLCPSSWNPQKISVFLHLWLGSTHFVVFAHTSHVVHFCLRFHPALSVLIVVITSFVYWPRSHSSTRTLILTHERNGSFLSTRTCHVPVIYTLVTESFTLVVFFCIIIRPSSAFLSRSEKIRIISTIKLDHVPLLESTINFPEWKRFTTQVLQAEGYSSHLEGTDEAYDILPKSAPSFLAVFHPPFIPISILPLGRLFAPFGRISTLSIDTPTFFHS